MMPHIHLLAGLIGMNLLKQWNINNLSQIMFLIGSIFPDIDLVYSLITKRNHREFITHFPLFWLFLGIFTTFFLFDTVWFFIGTLIHVFIDIIDWNVYLFGPFTKYSFTILNLDYEKITKDKRLMKSIQNYYSNRKILIIESTILLLFFLSFF